MNLPGHLFGLGGGCVLDVLHLQAHAIHGDGHLVDRIGSLLDQALERAHALVVGLLQARDGVLQLLDLDLELQDVLVLSA